MYINKHIYNLIYIYIYITQIFIMTSSGRESRPGGSSRMCDQAQGDELGMATLDAATVTRTYQCSTFDLASWLLGFSNAMMSSVRRLRQDTEQMSHVSDMPRSVIRSSLINRSCTLPEARRR